MGSSLNDVFSPKTAAWAGEASYPAQLPGESLAQYALRTASSTGLPIDQLAALLSTAGDLGVGQNPADIVRAYQNRPTPTAEQRAAWGNQATEGPSTVRGTPITTDAQMNPIIAAREAAKPPVAPAPAPAPVPPPVSGPPVTSAGPGPAPGPQAPGTGPVPGGLEGGIPMPKVPIDPVTGQPIRPPVSKPPPYIPDPRLPPGNVPNPGGGMSTPPTSPMAGFIQSAARFTPPNTPYPGARGGPVPLIDSTAPRQMPALPPPPAPRNLQQAPPINPGVSPIASVGHSPAMNYSGPGGAGGTGYSGQPVPGDMGSMSPQQRAQLAALVGALAQGGPATSQG